MTPNSPANESLEERMVRILAMHFDPEIGAPYWIEQSSQLRFDVPATIRHAEDLHRLGFMDQAAMRERPLSDFIPQSIWSTRNDLVIVQTGGTLGQPLWTGYTPEEYEAAFVTPFVVAANHVGFPSGGVWLYVGPSGPHVIGKAARSIATSTGAREPYAVDFDARWAKRLPPGSFAAQRYLAHVVEQALDIVKVQPITHLFSTPPVLRVLAEQMTSAQRDKIVGVHYGGLSIAPEDMDRLRTSGFPNAVHLAGYGNTLFGCCLELESSAGHEPIYFPRGNRLLFGTCPNGSDTAAIDYATTNQRGRCVFSRLDETMLLVNVLERDEITLAAPPADAPDGFLRNGAGAPRPAEKLVLPTVQNLY